MQVYVDNITVTVSGRVERIIRWLLSKRERIMDLERVKITFNCAGSTISSQLEEAEKV